MVVHLLSHKTCHPLLVLLKSAEKYLTKRRTNIDPSKLAEKYLAKRRAIYRFISSEPQASIYWVFFLKDKVDLALSHHNILQIDYICSVFRSLQLIWCQSYSPSFHNFQPGATLNGFHFTPLLHFLCFICKMATNCMLRAPFELFIRPQINLSLFPLQLFLSNTNANKLNKSFGEKKLCHETFSE